MPNSLEAAVVFAVLIVPGLLLTGGYNRTRAHALPRRDLYALAQAVVVSLAWLPVIWILGGGTLLGWSETQTLDDHQLGVIGVVILNLATALAAGVAAGALVDAIGDRPDSRLASALAWTGIFAPPTPWDYAWLRASTGAWAAVEITLSDGQVFNVLFDREAEVGLSPGPREGFFDTEYTWKPQDEGDDDLEVLPHDGVFIDGAEITSIRFEHIEPGEDS